MSNNNSRQIITGGDRNINISGDFMVSGNRNMIGTVISGGNVMGDKIMGDKSRSPRNLSQAIIEIQELLDKYSDIYNPNTPAGQEEIGKAVIESISQNPTLKERVINAIKEGGYTAIDETIDHPAAKILMGTLIAFC